MAAVRTVMADWHPILRRFSFHGSLDAATSPAEADTPPPGSSTGIGGAGSPSTTT